MVIRTQTNGFFRNVMSTRKMPFGVQKRHSQKALNKQRMYTSISNFFNSARKIKWEEQWQIVPTAEWILKNVNLMEAIFQKVKQYDSW